VRCSYAAQRYAKCHHKPNVVAFAPDRMNYGGRDRTRTCDLLRVNEESFPNIMITGPIYSELYT
jgi:hypothetical protein